MSLALALASASFLFVLSPIQTAQATQVGSFAYSWGSGTQGRLGHGNNNTVNTPLRIGDERRWIASATASGGSTLVCFDGYVWTMGPAGGQRGLGDNTISPNVPTQIPEISNIVTVASFMDGVAALSVDGHIYTWGSGPLGRPTTGAGDVPGNVPGRISVEGRPGVTFQYVAVGSAMYAICKDGYLYSWGTRLNGLIGRPYDAAHLDNAPFNRPGRVGTSNDWVQAGGSDLNGFAINNAGEFFTWGRVNRLGRPYAGIGIHTNNPGQVTIPPVRDAIYTNFAGAAITTDGRLFTWGLNDRGQLGRGIADTDYVASIPVQVGMRTDWHAVMGGNSHFLMFSQSGNLYAWGNNGSRQLGTETAGNRFVPELVVETSAFSTAARGGGAHSIMLMDTAARGDFALTKHLQKPYGTPAPDLNFRFTFERNSFNDNSTPADIARIPAISPVIINPTTVVNPNAPNPAPVGITTLEGHEDIFDGVVFTERGVYSWIVREDATHPSGAGANSSVVFSQASYELRVYVKQEAGVGGNLYIYYITLHRLTDPITGDDLDPTEKVDYLTFTNQYTRTTSANQHLNIHKYIEGNFADLSETFTFTATINRTALCSANTVNARLYRGTTFVETITFTFGQPRANITLGHNYRLVFDPLVIGSTFEVVEAACPLHIASVRVYSHAHPTTPLLLENTVPDQPRTTNVHIIGANTNATNFRNVHQFSPPTGLFLGTSTYIVIPLFAAGIITAASFATKARRRIEDMPLMH